MTTPVLILGAGRMGGALIDGWRRVGAFAAADLILRDPHPGPDALAAQAAGARLNPPDVALGEARTVLVAVKPQSGVRRPKRSHRCSRPTRWWFPSLPE